ncbi:MAG: polyprenyl synthetase family protein [Anaerolineae bacterium]|nr:polyprenyl synthetase family protein [Anaerolineae bacterium]
MLTIDEHVQVVHQIIQEIPPLAGGLSFPGFRKLLETVLADRAPSAGNLPWLMLPILTCEALEGDVSQAHHVAAAFEIGRIAAGCLDEWQDQDTDNALWRAIGAARAVNLALGLLPLSFLALSRLSDLKLEPSLVLALHEEFHRTLFDMSAGQDADLRDDRSLHDYEQIAGAKSGSLFRLGCRAGALVAGAPVDVAGRYGDFGYNLGVVAQMWNDLQGLAGLRGKGDAGQQRALPTLAQQAAEEMAAGPSPEAGQVGSLYTLVRIQVFHRRATEALARCPEPGRLSLFLDAYGMRHLVEKAQQTTSQQGEENAR